MKERLNQLCCHDFIKKNYMPKIVLFLKRCKCIILREHFIPDRDRPFCVDYLWLSLFVLVIRFRCSWDGRWNANDVAWFCSGVCVGAKRGMHPFPASLFSPVTWPFLMLFLKFQTWCLLSIINQSKESFGVAVAALFDMKCWFLALFISSASLEFHTRVVWFDPTLRLPSGGRDGSSSFRAPSRMAWCFYLSGSNRINTALFIYTWVWDGHHASQCHAVCITQEHENFDWS